MSDSSPQLRTTTEEIAGLVERVTFFSSESGFAVLRVKVRGQRDLVTVLGSVPTVSAGEWVTAKGWWVRDKEHGLQFKAQVLRATPPPTSELNASARSSRKFSCSHKLPRKIPAPDVLPRTGSNPAGKGSVNATW